MKRSDEYTQAFIAIDSCRKRIEFLKHRIDEEEKYLEYLKTKFAKVIGIEKEGVG